MPLDIANSYLLKYNKRKRGTPEEFNSVGADISEAGLNNGKTLETTTANIVYLDTENGDDANSGDSPTAAKLTYAAAAALITGSKTTIEQVNDFPITQTMTDPFQSTNGILLYDNSATSSSQAGNFLSVAYNGESFLKLEKTGGAFTYYLKSKTSSTWTTPTQTESYLSSNNPGRIFSNSGYFYLFFNDKTFRAGSDGIFAEISAVDEYAYDAAWTSQNLIKVADTAPPTPSDVTIWGSGNNWGNTSWENLGGAKRLMVQPLNLSSETPNYAQNYLDDDEEIQCVAVNSNDRVYIGTVNPEQGIPDDVAYWDTGEWDINTWWNQIAGGNSGRVWYSDDLSVWTMAHEIEDTTNEGVFSIMVNDSDYVFAGAIASDKEELKIAVSTNGTSFTDQTFTPAASNFFSKGYFINIANMPVLPILNYSESGGTYTYESFYFKASPAYVFSKSTITGTPAAFTGSALPDWIPSGAYGVYSTEVTSEDNHVEIYKADGDHVNVGNVIAAKSDTAGVTYRGSNIRIGTNTAGTSTATFQYCNIDDWDASAFTTPTVANSYIRYYNNTSGEDSLSQFNSITSSKLASLNYNTAITISNLDVVSLSISTVTQLSASLCKFFGYTGTLDLSTSGAVDNSYFSGDFSFVIANGSNYDFSHNTFNGNVNFTTADNPTLFTAENSIFLSLSFDDITLTANYVDIDYGGVVGALVGVTAGDNLRRDNPLFQPGTDGLLQRELDGFLSDSPYIRQSSTINTLTGANRDLGCYNIDDSQIAESFGTSVYLPKPPGGSITITETPLASVHTAISGQPDVFNDPSKRTEQVEITYPNIDNDVYEVYQEIETTLENMSVYLALDPYYLTDLPSVTTSTAASIGQTFIEIDPTVIFAGSRFSLSGIEYFIRYKVLNSSNQTTKIVLDRPLESAVSLGASLSLTHPVGTGEYQYIPQSRTFTRADSQDMEVKGPFKIVLVRKPE